VSHGKGNQSEMDHPEAQVQRRQLTEIKIWWRSEWLSNGKARFDSALLSVIALWIENVSLEIKTETTQVMMTSLLSHGSLDTELTRLAHSRQSK